MSIDKVALFADDPGGSPVEAWEILKAITHKVGASERSVTVISVAAEAGMPVAEAIRQKIEGNFPPWVSEAFGPNGPGLDICHPETRAVIAASIDDADQSKFTTEEGQVLLQMNMIETLKYPGLTPGIVQEARSEAAEREAAEV